MGVGEGWKEMRTSLQCAMTSSLFILRDASVTRQRIRSLHPTAPAQSRDVIPAASPFSLLINFGLLDRIFNAPSSLPLLPKTFPSRLSSQSPVAPHFRIALAWQSLVDVNACPDSPGICMKAPLQDDRFRILVVIFRKLGFVIQANTTSL